MPADRYSALERSALAPSAPGASNRAAGPGRLQVAQAQLQAHGFPTGHAPTGTLTPGTSTAIAQFQSSKGLTPTGTLDARTSDALAKPPRTAGRTVGSRRLKGGPIQVPGAHTRTNAGTTHASSAAPSSSVMTSTMQRTQGGQSHMDKSGSWTSAGKRVPLIFQSNGTVAAGATQTIPVQPQVPFRGENFVVDSTTGAFFSVVSFKVGVPDQNAGGSGNIPCSIYAPNQNGAIDYEMDLADSGTILQLTVINNDTVAHLFVGTLWGHEIMQG